jgi:tetratricopeptide (TPR) repeat protein
VVSGGGQRNAALGAGLLALAVFVVYLPVARCGFTNYDDPYYITENAPVKSGLTWSGLKWSLEDTHTGNWHPVTWWSHMLDCQWFGLRPAGHHLTNLALHAVNTVLLFGLLRTLTGRDGRSAVVAALFGLHPLHVESVAWVAERKDVLSGFFFLLTIWAYSNYVEQQSRDQRSARLPIWPVGCATGSKVHDQESCARREVSGQWSRSPVVWYVLALLLFACGLMSKPMVVTLPFVMLLLDYWPLRRAEWRIQNPESGTSRARLHLWAFLAAEKIPFFVLSAVACVLTILAQKESHAVVSTAGLPIGQRIAHAPLAYAHYLEEAFLPHNLAVYYPYEIAPAVNVLGAGIVLAAITFLVIRFRRSWPYAFVGWLWFLGTLIPVIGLVQVGEQAWADRYTYLPLIGVFVAAAWAVTELAQRTGTGTNNPFMRPGLFAVAIVIGLSLVIRTSVQLSYWKNTKTLFEHAERVTRDNHMAITLLGSLLAREGKIEEAIDRYHAALRIKPAYPEAHFFLGTALEQQGKTAEAIKEYRQVLWYKPVQEQAYIFLGAALAKQRSFAEAAEDYRAALEINPGSAVAHNNLARLLHTQGELEEARQHYLAALKFDPGLAQAHNNLGTLLIQQGKLADGAAELRESLRLSPGNLETQYNLAMALNHQQKWAEAADLFAKTVANLSGDANAHYEFALALQHLGKTREAMSHYASALLIQADFLDALDNLSWILSTSQDSEFRNGTEAVRMASRACQLTKQSEPEKLKTLAAAYAESGSFKEAVDTARAAMEIASNMGKDELANLCLRMSEMFASGKPWRDGPS